MKTSVSKLVDVNPEQKSDDEELENYGPRMPHHLNANVI